MAIITISRGSHSRGKEVAEQVAARLGYDCISREVLLEASDLFHVPELKLMRAIHDAPSLIERMGTEKKKYIAYIQRALTSMVQKDNVVYHGLAGHLLLRRIKHVLKVRVVADIKDRVALKMQREGTDETTARAHILSEDAERRKWTLALYGADPWDTLLYDLVIRIETFTVEDTVDVICRLAQLEHFKATRDSQQRMDDLAVTCQVKAALIDEFPDIKVGCEYGNVVVYIKTSEKTAQKLKERVASFPQEMKQLHYIEVHVTDRPPKYAV